MALGNRTSRGRSGADSRYSAEDVVKQFRLFARNPGLSAVGQGFLYSALALIPHAQSGTLLQLNEKEGVYEYKAAVGWDLEELSAYKIPQQELLQRQFQGKPAILKNPSKLRNLPESSRRILAKFPVAAFLSFPVVHEGKLIAYFNLDSLTDPDAFSQDDIERLRPLVDDLARAIHAEREREAARERDALFRLVWDRLADALFITDLDGTILECNAAAERQTGYGRDELVGMNIVRDLVVEDAPTRREETKRELNERLLKGEVIRFEEKKRRKDGTIYWTDCAVALLSEYQGRKVAVSLNRDITDRKELEVWQRTLFEESPVALWVEDFSRMKTRLDELRKSGVEDLDSYLAGHPEFIWDCIRDLRALDVNRAALAMYKASSKEELLARVSEVIPKEVIPLFKEELLAIWEGRTSFSGEGVNRDLAGNTIHVALRWNVVPGHEDTYDRVIASLEDITARKQALARLNEYARKLTALHNTVQRLQRCTSEQEVLDTAIRAIQETLGFDFCAIDLADGDRLVLRAASPAAAAVARRENRGEGIAGRTWRERRAFWGDIEDFPEAKPVRGDLRSIISVPIGDFGVLQIASTEPGAFREEDVELVEILAGHLREELERVRLEEELRQQAIRDPLTGLYNRRYLTEALERELGRARRYRHPFAILIADLDNFKRVNDQLGHPKGDKVLVQLAQLIRSTARESDLMFRYGGDEFLLILPETDGKAKALAERLQQAVAGWAKEHGLAELGLGLSVGIAVWYPDSPRSAEELLVEADRALYRIKEKKLGGASDRPPR
jgi:diguanylate cyclase (GGDEF)-like protein/PAS domain S-box-containing protein